MADTERLSPAALDAILANREAFLAFLTARVGSSELAGEILQDALVRGVEKGGQLRDDESAVAWFYRLLRNAIVDERRRRGAAERALERFAMELETTESAPDDALHGAVCACIGGLLPTLRPDYAEAIRAVDLDGAVVRDFAASRGITANNAAVRLHRARQALEQRVRVTCGACAVHGCIDCTCAATRGG